MIKNICVVSIPRTGTNHLFNLAKGFSRLKVRFEVFHDREAFSLTPKDIEKHSRFFKYNFTSAKDRNLIKTIRENPVKTLETLSSFPEKITIFKVFQDHLTDTTMDELLAMNGIAVLFVLRKPIDSYISLLKANAIQKWEHEDTSRLIVTLKKEDFLIYRESKIIL